MVMVDRVVAIRKLGQHQTAVLYEYSTVLGSTLETAIPRTQHLVPADHQDTKKLGVYGINSNSTPLTEHSA